MLKINNVSKSFAGLIAVDQCSFAIREGTISALIGPNGAGKSTLFNCISRIYPVDSGEIYYADNRLDLLPPHKIARLGIGRSFQLTRTLDHLSVTENLALHTAGGFGSHLLQRGVTISDKQRADLAGARPTDEEIAADRWADEHDTARERSRRAKLRLPFRA